RPGASSADGRTAPSERLRRVYRFGKVGVADGDVRWGIVGGAENARAAYYFQGPAIDRCSGAEKAAGPGQIVADAGFWQRLGIVTGGAGLARAEAFGDHYLVHDVTGPLPDLQPVQPLGVDVDAMARFYPRRLIERDLNGEFRHVVSLFISLPTVRRQNQLASFMQTLFELQEQYGGLLSGLRFGDKGSNLLLFWGMPTAYENDIFRTLNFVLDLQTRTSIPIDAGITYQIAYAGHSGSTLRDDYTAHGRGVNLAARFMAAASRGEIWVDETIARRAKAHFEIESLGERSFKGFAQPQKVFLLLERQEQADAFYAGGMVGRQDDLGALADFVAPLWQGLPAGRLLVSGDPGIGKSRLVHAFLAELNASGSSEGRRVTVVLGQTDEILREPLNPWRYWLRRYFGQSEHQSEARNKRNFNSALDLLLAESEALDENLCNDLDRTRSFSVRWPGCAGRIRSIKRWMPRRVMTTPLSA
ncbi:MAG: AAA family ATPase, partial [Caldilineaceae bacterium]|nr:AAA family ATPase [Caldilineaceae bacterium]